MRTFLAALCALCLVLAGATVARAEYVLQRGDVLHISVVGAPVDQRMPVNVDGQIVVPLAGSIPAAGRSLEEVTADITAALSRVSIPILSERGVPTAVQVSGNAITVSVVEYRPVYVDGDVRTPGAYTFRPGITAQQAIALAGGFGLDREDVQNPELTRADLRGQIAGLTARRTAALARLDRLKQQLQEGAESADGTDAERPTETLLSKLETLEAGTTFRDRFGAIESAQLEAHRAGLDLHEGYLAEGQSKANLRLETLNQRATQERQGVEADAAEFDNLVDLSEKGMVTAARLGDARRALLYSSTRELQTMAEISRTERELDDLVYRIRERAADENAEALLDFRDELVNLAEINASLEAAKTKLIYVGGGLSDLDPEEVVSISILRDDGERVDPATPETRLLPGDTVTATLDIDGEIDPALQDPAVPSN